LENYLNEPSLDRDARRQFVQNEITYTDGTASVHTANYLLSLLEGGLG